MTPVQRLLEKLPGARKVRNGWSARCPAHDDQHPSLSFAEGDDGRALVKCHAGCSFEAIVAALGLTTRDMMPKSDSPVATLNGKRRSSAKTFLTANAALVELERQHGKLSASWTYHDTSGNPVGLVVRWDLADGKKDIRPVSRHWDGWHLGAMPEPRPLYALTELANAKRVLVVEGEKCAEAARSLGFIATTSVGGAGAARKTDWGSLAGKEVWILPDNDLSGRKYADSVANILAKLNPIPAVKVIELPGLAKGGDIADWIDARGDGVDREAMRAEIETLAETVETEAPDVSTDEVARFRQFPVDALPQPIRGFVDAGAKAIGCDPSFLALPLLIELAAAIGNTRRLELKRGWYAPPIIWGAIVGESGTSKTPAFKLVMRPARERQRKALERHAAEVKQFEADYAHWEKEYAAWKRSRNTVEDAPAKPDAPRAQRYIVSDTTIEALAPILMSNPRGVLLARDELAGWIGSFDRYAGKGKAGADAANWLSMFNAENIIVDRKTGMPKTVHVAHAAVCVCGGIQPGILKRALAAEHRESGLAARLLLAWPVQKAKKWTEADIDPRSEAWLAELFDRLYGLEPGQGEDGEARPVLVRLSPEAKAAWVAYYNAHAQEQADLTGDLSAAWSKLEEYAARLALVIHFTRWAANDRSMANADILDAESMAAGITLTEWFKHEARRVYTMLGESDADGNHRKLIEWIERKDGSVTTRQVQQGCRWLKESGAAEKALEELVKAGLGTWREPETSEKGGRPPRVFDLSTPSTVYKTPRTQLEGEGSVDVDNVDQSDARAEGELDQFPFGFNNPDDPDGGRLFPDSCGLPD